MVYVFCKKINFIYNSNNNFQKESNEKTFKFAIKPDNKMES